MPPVESTLATLERDGIVLLPDLFSAKQIDGMRGALSLALSQMRLNDLDGYLKTERLRDMVEDVLLLDQAFLSLAVDPRITDIVRGYVGNEFQLVECKGWRSRPTMKDWHGWHGDAWYDQTSINRIPRELKLGLYLSDVRSGGFAYLKGSHGKVAPRSIPQREIGSVWSQEQIVVDGAPGTAFLFDTSGIHRQSTPILEPRLAVFYCYHDASLPLQQEDRDYGRYHPLFLNAAFLGGLSMEQQRILGFGNTRNFRRQLRPAMHPILDALFANVLQISLRWGELREPFDRRLRPLLDRIKGAKRTDDAELTDR